MIVIIQKFCLNNNSTTSDPDMFVDTWRKYVMHIFRQETKEKEKYTGITKESVENNLVMHIEAKFNKQINFQDIQKKEIYD